jgi:ADP-ribose pyrophosphatase YjhB (NUDIX family)
MQNSCGILFISKPTKKIGLGLRSEGNDNNTWSTIGGEIELGETILDCLKREIKEELGIELNTKLIPLDDNGKYKTFISLIDSEFNPTLNREHSDFKWFDYSEIPENIHPELKKTLNKPFVIKVLNNHLIESTTTASVGGYVQPLGSPLFRTNVGDNIKEGIVLKSRTNHIEKEKKEIIDKLIEKTKTLPLKDIDLKDLQKLKEFSVIDDDESYLEIFHERIMNEFSEIDVVSTKYNMFYFKNKVPYLKDYDRIQVHLLSPMYVKFMGNEKSRNKFNEIFNTKYENKIFYSTKELIEIIEKVNEMQKNMNERIVFTKKQLMEDVELSETTSTDSTGSYETPAAWAKSMNKKHWRHANKPIYPGGKFMKVKEKCKKFPYCNQGDINAIELWEDEDLVKETIKELSKEMNISERIISKIYERNQKNG